MKRQVDVYSDIIKTYYEISKGDYIKACSRRTKEKGTGEPEKEKFIYIKI